MAEQSIAARIQTEKEVLEMWAARLAPAQARAAAVELAHFLLDDGHIEISEAGVLQWSKSGESVAGPEASGENDSFVVETSTTFFLRMMRVISFTNPHWHWTWCTAEQAVKRTIVGIRMTLRSAGVPDRDCTLLVANIAAVEEARLDLLWGQVEIEFWSHTKHV